MDIVVILCRVFRTSSSFALTSVSDTLLICRFVRILWKCTQAFTISSNIRVVIMSVSLSHVWSIRKKRSLFLSKMSVMYLLSNQYVEWIWYWIKMIWYWRQMISDVVAVICFLSSFYQCDYIIKNNWFV